MKNVLIPCALALACGMASAKLPPPDDAAKAKAAEAAAKAAWQGKLDTFQLCKAQDRVAAGYKKTSGGGKPAPGSAAMPVAAKPAAGASAPPTTPVSAAAPSPCSDPGPFAYTPPEQKPLETSGAHSPPGTASSPPSVRTESAKMTPAAKKP